MSKPKHKPGDIVAGRRRPRKGEILCHNHITHTADTRHGERGFRWFSALPKATDWKVCPCGWRPDLGTHYAIPEHVKWWRQQIKKLGSKEAVYRSIHRRLHPAQTTEFTNEGE